MLQCRLQWGVIARNGDILMYVIVLCVVCCVMLLCGRCDVHDSIRR